MFFAGIALSIALFIAMFILAILWPQQANILTSRFEIWGLGWTKINYMQSMFQLGIATSAAFAIAGPEIRHALGPSTKGVTEYIKVKMKEPNSPVDYLKRLVQELRKYDNCKNTNAKNARP